jgi:hypothetical protein
VNQAEVQDRIVQDLLRGENVLVGAYDHRQAQDFLRGVRERLDRVAPRLKLRRNTANNIELSHGAWVRALSQQNETSWRGFRARAYLYDNRSRQWDDHPDFYVLPERYLTGTAQRRETRPVPYCPTRFERINEIDGREPVV